MYLSEWNEMPEKYFIYILLTKMYLEVRWLEARQWTFFSIKNV